MNIGKSLKIALLDTGKTQLEVADDLGISPVLLSRHFNSDSISLTLANKYADYFDLRTSELIALSEFK